MKQASITAFLFCILFPIFSQVTPLEKAALQAFYNSTNGPNWISENDADPTNDWDFSGPVTNNWYGVIISGGNVVALDHNSGNGAASRNNLSGTLPPEVGDLTELELLDLSFEELSGSIPPTIGNLSKVRQFYLRFNDFSGQIPPVITSLKELTDLNLRGNQLSGSIPADIGTLNNLQNLVLSENQLSGSIPASIGLLTNLKVLWLGENQLSGQIPVQLGNATDLVSLLIHYNQLMGEIPRELGNLSNLRVLWLSENQLSGVLPDELGNLIAVESLLLNNNQFEGSIPQTFENFINLQGLWMHFNQLSGPVPDIFERMTDLETLQLQNNQFSGELPASMELLSSLNFFYCRNNDLEGAVPNFTLTPVQFFDIKNNKYQFGGFEAEFPVYSSYSFFDDNPQALVNEEATVHAPCGGPQQITLSTTVTGSQNRYQWYKGIFPGGTLIPGATNANLIFDPVQPSDAGDYYCLINSDIVTDLELRRNPLHLVVQGGPVVANGVSDITACDDNNDGFAAFTIDLQALEATVLGGQTGMTIRYFDAAGDPLTLTNPFTNTTPNQQAITIQVEEPLGCTAETTLNLVVLNALDLDAVSDVMECDSYILPELTNGNYFTAPSGGGMMLNEGDELTTTQTVYIFADNGDCASEVSFEVEIIPTPLADNLSDQTACDSFLLPVLVQGNYFTQSGGAGQMLFADDLITTSQTVFVFAENGNCSSETSFEITINPAPAVDIPENVVECVSYKLPDLVAGNYFTETNGGGTLLNARDEITVSQTVYVFANDGRCTSESSFDVTITGLETKEITPNQLCIGEMYELPDGRIVTQTGSYTVELSDGCIVEVHNLTFEACECQPKMVTAFTPNNNGVNDRFQLILNPGCTTTVTNLEIYDRWGGLVYAATGNNFSWTGNNAPQGVYIWQIQYELTDANGVISIAEQTGTVTLLK